MKGKDLVKLHRVVDSCETFDQLRSANTYVNLMVNRYAFEATRGGKRITDLKNIKSYALFYMDFNDRSLEECKRLLTGHIYNIRDL